MTEFARDAIQAPEITPLPGRTGEYRLTCELKVPYRREQVFEFFSDAHELERITPAWLKFQVRTPRPVEMRPGALIDYKLRLHGIPIRWKTEISAWQPPFRFVDRQIKGTYRYWQHEHTFKEIEGGTLVRDRVEYGVPGGRLVHCLLVEKDLIEIFSFRQYAMWDIFEQEKVPTHINSEA